MLIFQIFRLLMHQKLSKVCNSCGEEKAISSFHKDKRSADGLTGRCAKCRCKTTADWQKEQKQTNPVFYSFRRKNNNYNSKYGLSLQQVEEKLTNQNYKCSICKKSLRLLQYAVDHNHQTNEVRDLLCQACNKGLGFFYDNPEFLREAASYLERHNDSIA